MTHLTDGRCLISDALLKLSHPFGGHLPGLTMWSPERQQGTTKLVGPAYTVKFARVEEKNAPIPKDHYVGVVVKVLNLEMRGLIRNSQIDTIPERSVIFISPPKGIPSAVYGGLMTYRAKASNAAGTVVDGTFRDLDEHRASEWPVNVSVRFSDGQVDAIIYPGDWIVGDLNGVICIPQALVHQVVEMLEPLAAAEARIEEDLVEGICFAESSKRHRA
nr:4-hydroxy-4-methyl-2-oxoglutarate aldolase [Quercus suber]